MVCKSWRALVLVAAPASAAYDESVSLTFASLSTASMCSTGVGAPNETSLETWQCGPACDAVPGMTDVRAVDSGINNDAFAYVGKLNGDCIAVFRGTTQLSGWIEDLKSAILVEMDPDVAACSYGGVTCKVGKGFMDNYKSLAGFLKGNLSAIGCYPGSKMSVTGHSLGAAEAALAMFDLKGQGFEMTEQYTFGQPRVGDSTFASAFNEAFGNIGIHRVTHADDPVPMLPGVLGVLGFTHVATEVYYESTTRKGYKICDGSGEDDTCNAGRSLVKGSALCAVTPDRCPHLTYLTKLKSFDMTGDSCSARDQTSMVMTDVVV